MSFKDSLTKSLEDRPVVEWKRAPEVLLLPQIPKPLHGVAPRVVLGSTWWNKIRQETYKSTNLHCIACGVHKTRAKGPKHLEAHEIYRTVYEVFRLYFVRVVPLCNFCHSYIHCGRLQALLDQNKITQRKFVSVIQHGDRVLANAGLVKTQIVEESFEKDWGKWRLVLGRKMYKPKFRSFEEWKTHFGRE